ncbi:MAG: hypothetical protein VX771_11800, partial [Pseudomonadota bacterium]|nr:hypothetical protein [Pseudomonadota bacterium]
MSDSTYSPEITDVVIAAFGGINAAGRASGHQAYRRIIYDALSPVQQTELQNELANLTDQPPHEVLNNSLVRAWDKDCPDL